MILKLKEIRERLGISQETVAKELCCSLRTLRKWESGKSEPSLTMLCMLANYFLCSTDALLGRGENK